MSMPPPTRRARRRRSATVLALAVLAAGVPAAGPATASVAGTARVSVTTAGAQGSALSTRPAISADGRYLAFGSGARLVGDDTNGSFDVYVRDQAAGTTTRVSVSSLGRQGDKASFSPAISADGRYVAFSSFASTLVPGDRNGVSDVFVHDRRTGATRRVTVSSAGVEGDKYSSQSSLSADGQRIAYSSHSTNLVPGDRNSEPDTFVHDLTTGTTVRASVSTTGREAGGDSHAPSISADGSLVAFFSTAGNLVTGDTNEVSDAFVRDLRAASTTRVSLSSSGGQANGASFGPSLSGSGRLVTFSSKATNLVPADRGATSDVYLHDRVSGTTTLVSTTSTGGLSNGSSQLPALDPSGRYLAYSSSATNLVPGDRNRVMDVFRRDLASGAVVRVSVSAGGGEADGASAEEVDAGNATVSTTGAVGFYSEATNLVPGDTNGVSDIFVRQPGA